MMYVTATDVIGAKIESLASQLVLSAKRAEKLSELFAAVDQRSANPATKLAASAMKAMIAIEQTDNDEAAKQLQSLFAQVSSGAVLANVHVAILPALHAFEMDALKSEAFPIIRQALQAEVQSSSASENNIFNNNTELKIDGRLANMVNGYLSATGDEASIKDSFESVMVARQGHYGRHGGDYGLYLQSQDLGTLAQQAATLGMPNVALDFLGRTCDFEVGEYSRPTLALPLAIVTRNLQTPSPGERFDAWHRWTMPTEGRQTVRFINESYRQGKVPKAFLDPLSPYLEFELPSQLSNFTELIDAAEQAKKLDDLRLEVGNWNRVELTLLDNVASLSLNGELVSERPIDHVQGKRIGIFRYQNQTAKVRAATLSGDWQNENIETVFANLGATSRTSSLEDRAVVGKIINDEEISILAGEVVKSALMLPPEQAYEHLMKWVMPSNDHANIRLDYGSLEIFPAETWTQLYFQSPLRGKFEITAEHSTYGYREAWMTWGNHAAQPSYDLSQVDVVRLMHGATNVGGKVDLPVWDTKAETKMQVDGNEVITTTNGVEIHKHYFTSPASPWLVIQANVPMHDVSVTNVRITGTPEIPDEIDMIDMDGLSHWRADLYGEWHSTDVDATSPWKRVGDELVGSLRERVAAEHLESLLLYQRPMLEDGVIEFETWYEPGKFEVHPAVGPDAFLIRPAGVSRHRMTNAQYETSGLDAGNESPIDSSVKTIELKENDWNKIRLTLTGDRLAIAVNGSEVVAADVSVPANLRQFGLFRYGNKTQSRVRDLRYRGEWPKTSVPAKDDGRRRSNTRLSRLENISREGWLGPRCRVGFSAG